MDKKILKNYLYDMLREIVIVLLPLIVVPYVSRVMTPKELGIYSYSINIVTYFNVVAELGFQFLGRKEIAKATTKDERNEIFLKVFFLRFTFVFIVNLLYFLVVPNIMEPSNVYILQGLTLIAAAFDISWYYIGIEDFKRITVRSIFYKVFNLILIFLCVKGDNVLLKYIICMGLPNIFGNLIMFYKLGIKWKIPKFSSIEVKKYMASAIILLVPTLLKSLYTIIDKSILGRLSTMEEVSYYSQTFKLLNVLIAIVYSIGTVSFTRLVTCYHQEDYDSVKRLMKEIVTFVLHIGFPIIMGLICVSDIFVSWFYGEQYLILNKLLPIASPFIIITALNNVLCSQYLMAINKEKILIKNTFIGVIVNLLFDALLIPRLGAEGAIIASIISEGTVMGLSSAYYRRTMNGKLLEFENIKCVISSIVMMIVLMYLKDLLIINDILKTFILVGLGVMVYFIIESVLRDSWFVNFVKKFTRKLNGVKRSN